MENCWGLFGEGKKFNSSIFEVGIMDYLKAYLELFLISFGYLYFATFRSVKVCILNKVSRYGCEKECGYINFFLM